jgi:hypothetical protein
MFAAIPSKQARPISVLLGGSGMRRIVEQKKPDVGVLLKPDGLRTLRSPQGDVATPPWEADHHDPYRKRVSALVVEMAKDDPELVLEKIVQLQQSGEIAPDELAHIERIARQWVKISRDNLKKGQP